jgi:hypothetical protein
MELCAASARRAALFAAFANFRFWLPSQGITRASRQKQDHFQKAGFCFRRNMNVEIEAVAM